MSMKNKLFYLGLVAAIVMSTASRAEAQILLQWNTAGNTGTETTEASAFNDSKVAASTLTLGPGVTPAANADRFGGSNWYDTGDVSPTNVADAIADGEYFSFTVAPLNGASLSLTSFAFVWDRSGTGPASFSLRSSADNYAADLGAFTSAPLSATATLRAIDLTGYSSITSETTFRLYAYGATSTSGTGGFDVVSGYTQPNVQLFGNSASAVPEPSTYAALAGACALMGVVVARQRRREEKKAA